MRVLSAIVAAFGTFSRVPVPKAGSIWEDDGARYALAAFPLVGILQGALVVAWGLAAAALGVPSLVTGAVLLAIPLAVNGGIHLDGLCDTADALASYAPREKRLEILRDPRAGAFGVVAVGTYLVLDLALLTSLPLDARTLCCLPAIFVVSRALSGVAMETWPKARRDGMARALSGGESPVRRWLVAVLAAFALVGAVTLGALAGAVGVLVLAAMLAVLAWYRHVAMVRFGGVTGDLAGWFLQWAELAGVAVLVIGGLR